MEIPPPPPAPPMPPEPIPRKGLHPMAWVGIGCGGLLVIAVLGIALAVGFFKRKVNEFQQEMAANPHKTAAEMIVGMNPDLEMVADDETAGEMTVRIKSSGEEVTVSYTDLAEGRFTVKDGKGSVTSIGAADDSQVPAWVPRHPDSAGKTGVVHKEMPDSIEGVWVFSTNDTPEEVRDFFSAGIDWSKSGSSTMTNLGSITQLEESFEGGGRELKLIAASGVDGQPTQVTVSYKETKP